MPKGYCRKSNRNCLFFKQHTNKFSEEVSCICTKDGHTIVKFGEMPKYGNIKAPGWCPQKKS